MLVSKDKIEIPDECPKDCPYKQEAFYQGCVCHRCPIFSCKEYDGFRLIEPEGYRDDWAREWDKFFKTGDPPILKLHYEGEK